MVVTGPTCNIATSEVRPVMLAGPRCGSKYRDSSYMSETGSIQVQIDAKVKCEVEAILAALGLTPADAITLLYNQIRRDRGLLGSTLVPNAETLDAMRQARSGEGLSTCESVDDLMAGL